MCLFVCKHVCAYIFVFCLCVSVFVPMYLCFPLSVSMYYGPCVCLFVCLFFDLGNIF